MKTFLGIVLFLAILIAATGVFLIVYGRERTWEKIAGASPDLSFDLATLTRSTKPNDGLLCTPGLCPQGVKTDGDLPIYDATPSELIEKIQQSMQTSGLRMRRMDTGADPNMIRFITWTETLRFPDINQFWAVPMENGKTGLVAYARAQVGYSDRGNNLNRMRAITAKLQ